MEEARTIAKIKNGNKQELEKVYIMYRTVFIKWMVSQYKLSLDEAADIYQQTILVLYENIINEKLISLKSSMKTYLFSIGKNKAYEWNRKQRKYSGMPVQDLPANEEDQTQEAYTNQLLNISQKSLKILGNPCKTLLELYYFHRRNMQEIADQMGYKNENSTKNQKYKCLNKLREIFKAEIQKEKLVGNETYS